MKKIVLSLIMLGLGTFAMAQNSQLPSKMVAEEIKQDREQKRARHLETMKEELNLTEAQVAQLRSLQDKKQAVMQAHLKEMERLRAQKHQEIQQQHQEMDKEMRRILTAQQYQLWSAKQAEKKAKIKERKAKKMMEHRRPKKQ